MFCNLYTISVHALSWKNKCLSKLLLCFFSMILVIDLESCKKKVSQEFPPNFPKIILYKGQAYK